MKKTFFYALLCVMTIGNIKAADRYVRDQGAGGSYSTISAAIAAASDGDRIIIRPKAAGLPFIENITINKSLTFVSETNFSKYVLQGTVSVTPLAGRIVTIHNMSSASTINVSAATTGGRTTLNILNSLFSTVDGAYANTSVNMSGCEVADVNITHGRLTGNKTDVITVKSKAGNDTNISDDEVEIIANKIGGSVLFEQNNYAFKFLNNYVKSSSLKVWAAKLGSSNEIRNNVINGGEYGSIFISLFSSSTSTFFILNNVLTCNSTLSNYYEISNENSYATVYAINNTSTTKFTTNGVAVSSGNFASSSLTFNTDTFSVSGSAIINAGVADDEYADLDLSRNDIGNFGGSDSWANYWPTNVGNKPQVNYLKTPRRIYTGTTEMNAIGSGYSK